MLNVLWGLICIALLFSSQREDIEWISYDCALGRFLTIDSPFYQPTDNLNATKTSGSVVRDLSIRWPFWKRQSTSGVVPAQPHQTNGLTNSTTAGTSGAAGNNPNGTVPGFIPNTAGGTNSQYVNCSDVTTGRANKCWAELNLTQYVQDWRSSAVCFQGEGFSSCYLRQNGFPGLDCHTISGAACTAPQSDAAIDDPKRFYVAYNIYGQSNH